MERASAPTEAERLQAELQKLQKRLQEYEGPDEKATADEEKRKIKKVFDLFDVDGSGDLDAGEFQELAFLLGETLTLDEVKDRIKQIDQDGSGTIDFKEFYEWWISPDHSFLTNSKKGEQMSLLKAKLRSKSFVRTISRLNEKEKEKATKREEDVEVDDNLVKFAVNLAVGEFQENSPFKIHVNFDDNADKAAILRNSIGASEDSFIASMSFTVKDGTTDFELGEVSGALKLILAFAKKELQYSSYKIGLAEEDGKKVFRVSVVLDKSDFPNYETVNSFIQSVHPVDFSALLELSQSPKTQKEGEALQGRVQVKGSVQTSAVDLLKHFLQLDDENLYYYYIRNLKFKAVGLQILSLLRNLDLDLKLDSMADLYDTAIPDQLRTSSNRSVKNPLGNFQNGESFGILKEISRNGWGNVKPLIGKWMASELLRKEEAQDEKTLLIDNYFNALRIFNGIHSVHLQAGNLVLHLNAKGFDVFDLFPSQEELEQYKDQERLYGVTSLTDSRRVTRGQAHLEESDLEISEEPIHEILTSEPKIKNFIYSSDQDENGIIFYLDYKLDAPPAVLASSVGRGTAEDFIERENTYVWTQNRPFSWFCVDLGPNHRVVPARYTLKYASSGSFCCPRNWLLQAAVRLTGQMDQPESGDWVTLSRHVDDKSLNSSFATCSWDVTDPDHPVTTFSQENENSETVTWEGYRYFRVIQTGPNSYQVPEGQADAWSNVLVATGFELYGQLISKLNEDEEISEEFDFVSPGEKMFSYLYKNDNNGVIHNLIERTLPVRVNASSIARGHIRDFIRQGDLYTWTQNRPFSWFSVDFGPKRRVTPVYYSMRYGSGGNACCPRNWLLQGANELKDNTSNPDSEDWTTLSSHKNDKTLNSDHATGSWPIEDCSESFRYFRVIQTGPNCFSGGSGWKDVLVASGFEIYGTLHVLDVDENVDDDSDADEPVDEDVQQ